MLYALFAKQNELVLRLNSIEKRVAAAKSALIPIEFWLSALKVLFAKSSGLVG